jgi:two-component system sensor histidine kinase ChiS
MRAKACLLLLLLLALVYPTTVQAKESPARFERISIEQGLSQVTIYCILQDSRGLMWFGTEDGLNRYDGYNFTIYKRDPADLHSLSANTIRVIYEDAAGMLWIGTDGGGLSRFDHRIEQFTQYRHDPDNPDSLSSDTVTAIYADASGMLWVGTDGEGLDRLDLASGKFSHYRHDPNVPDSLSSNAVTAILADPAGVLWVGTRGGGLNQLNRATDQFVRYRNDPRNLNSLSNDDVNTLFLGGDGSLWAGTNAGLIRLDLQTRNFTRYNYDSKDPYSLSDGLVRTIYEDSRGTVWVGTPNGLNELDRQSQQFVHYQNDPRDANSLSLDDITAIYEDASGILWIGTTVGGLNKLDNKTRRFVHYRNDPNDPNSLLNNTVWALLEDKDGIVWVGTSGSTNGLDRLDRQTGQFTHYQNDPKDAHSLPSASVLAIYQDSAGTLWVGTYESGLNRLDQQTGPPRSGFPQSESPQGGSPQSGSFTHYRHDPADPDSLSNNIVWAFLEDTAGRFWVGTMGGGLNLLDRASGKFTHFLNDPANPDSLSSDYILYLYEDQAGTIWVGTTQGLDQLIESGAANQPAQQFVHYRNDPADPHSLSSNAVPAIYEDASGKLWIGTDDGLNRFDPATETFTVYTENDGLANDAIACILGDNQGYLWISSGKGLSKLDPHTGQFKNYDARDGLQSNEFNRDACYKNAQGEMFFGGINGFNVFNPVDITDNPYSPPVVLTDFQIFNKPVTIGDGSPLKQSIGETKTITLPYWDYVFSFEFAALDYTLPSKNQYAYKLEGFDRDWNVVDSSRRFASYANLPAGSYTFRVKGSNNDGVWNENGVELGVIVTPPPWKTWWAYTLYVLLGISILAAVWRYRSKEVARKHLEHTMWAVQSERDRIAGLLESRRQLVASISHDLRTPVAIVRGHLESVLSDGQQWQPFIQKLEVMSQELDRLQALLDDLFTLSRLEVDRLTLRLAPMDAVITARRAVAAIATPAWRQGKVEVTMDAAQAEIWVVADEQRLLQVMMNLLHNAVRHTLPGGIVVLGLNYQSEGVAIRVQDTGEGITPADLPNIWERFYRGQSQAGGGTGLGLALVKELTEAMGGNVAVKSVLGEGSCFTVTLPRSVGM